MFACLAPGRQTGNPEAPEKGGEQSNAERLNIGPG
jgi:hypothetical protein